MNDRPLSFKISTTTQRWWCSALEYCLHRPSGPGGTARIPNSQASKFGPRPISCSQSMSAETQCIFVPKVLRSIPGRESLFGRTSGGGPIFFKVKRFFKPKNSNSKKVQKFNIFKKVSKITVKNIQVNFFQYFFFSSCGRHGLVHVAGRRTHGPALSCSTFVPSRAPLTGTWCHTLDRLVWPVDAHRWTDLWWT